MNKHTAKYLRLGKYQIPSIFRTGAIHPMMSIIIGKIHLVFPYVIPVTIRHVVGFEDVVDVFEKLVDGTRCLKVFDCRDQRVQERR